MYRILINGECVYACTDLNRFACELSNYAGIANCTLDNTISS